MKEELSELSFNSIEIYVPGFDCNIDSGSKNLNCAPWNIILGPDFELITCLESGQFKLHLLSLTDWHLTLLPQFHFNVHWHIKRHRPRCRTRLKSVPRLDQHREENWDDTDLIPTSNIVKSHSNNWDSPQTPTTGWQLLKTQLRDNRFHPYPPQRTRISEFCISWQ